MKQQSMNNYANKESKNIRNIHIEIVISSTVSKNIAK
uniref:Uncharacterized protein n=1 Tax=Ascaris lumbricoides TaxID=6252 RepID=A0A9J2PR41_ASCLU